MNANQATASRSSISADTSPVQKCKRVDEDKVINDERSRKNVSRGSQAQLFKENVPLRLHAECKSRISITYDKYPSIQGDNVAGAPALYQRSIHTLTSALISKSTKPDGIERLSRGSI
jgi:hypothetical protein